MKYTLSFPKGAVAIAILLFSFLSFGTSGQTISTFAGGIGDDSLAADYGRIQPLGITLDTSGNLYITDYGNLKIRKVDRITGIISTIAGTGESGYFADGDLAYYTPVYANGAKIDNSGNMYLLSSGTISKISPAGRMYLVAGNGTYAYSGDGSAATSAGIGTPRGITFDAGGNIYFTDDYNHRIRKINTAGLITTIAGTGTAGFSGDGGPASAAMINAPQNITIDRHGRLYFADYGNNLVRMIDTSGIISTFAGSGSSGFGDGGPATAAYIPSPLGVAFDAAGNFYISDYITVRKVDTSGIINRVGGTASAGFSGDGGAATAATFDFLSDIAVDSFGNIFVVDQNNARIRKINTAGIVSTYAGTGAISVADTDGSYRLRCHPRGMTSLKTDPSGNIYYNQSHKIRRIDKTTGLISTVAGQATPGFSGDGGPATAAHLQNPDGMAFDRYGNMYIADYGNHHVRKISTSGIITTVAGGGTGGLGDGGPATAAQIFPTTLDVDTAGNLFVVERGYNRIRKIDASTGIITTIASITSSYSILDIACDRKGNVFYSYDVGIIKLSSTGTTTYIGTAAYRPYYLSLDTVGNIYFSDRYNYSTIYQIDTNNYYHLIAGKAGYRGYLGENTPAINSRVYVGPITLDRDGQLYLTQYYGTIRKISYLSANVDAPPLFVRGATQTMSACSASGSPSVALDTFMRISDGDVGDSVRWYVSTSPSHGTLSGFPYAAIVGSGVVTPSGFTYTPTTGYVGSDNFTITVTDGIDTNKTVVTVTVAATVTSGTISGATFVCIGTPRNYSVSGATYSGTWSLTNSNATISASGQVTGVTPGRDTILYTVSTLCGTSISSKVIDVYNVPTAASISGATALCAGATTTLTASISGGTWSSSSVSRATVSSTGVVTGVSGGTVNITYNTSNPCGTAIAVQTMTINPAPTAGTISGPTFVCIGTPRNYSVSGATYSGTWSLTNSNATISASGQVTGVTPGRDTILYTVSSSCGTSVSSNVIDIYNVFSSASISGASVLCAGTNTALTPSLAGGTWSSSSIARATVSSTGVVTGVSAGTVNISYVLSNPCGTAIAVQTMTINPAPTAGSIFGASTVCVGDSVGLSSSISGGVWSVVTGNAGIGTSGVVTGVSAGLDTVVYTVTNSCGTANAFKPITVNPAVLSGTISGAGIVCVGTSATLSSTVAGGTWSTSDPYITIGSVSGVVSGVASGTAMVTYAVSSSCGVATDTALITVNPALSAGTITGASSVCIGSSIALSTTGSGGTWSSSNTSIATVSGSGVVAGVTGGAVLISYTITSPCGTAVAITLVNVTTATSIGAITGASSVCAGGTTTLSHALSGGTWISSTSSIASVSTSGIVTGVTAGVATISYVVSAGCGVSVATTSITVNSTPDAGTLSGSASLCAGSVAVFTSSSTGGTWTTSSASVASVSPSGVVYGVSAGTVLITYTISNSCGTASATYASTVSTAPIAGTISGAGTVCSGATTTLTSSGSGGVWSSGSSAIASISASGVVFGVSTGSATIFYTVTNGCGSVAATHSIAVNTASAGIITGVTTLCIGSGATLGSTVTGGAWSSSTPSVASISSGGTVIGISAGIAVISYSVSSSCGSAISTMVLNVNGLPTVAAISGTTTICAGSTSTLSDATSGGVWTSSAASIASVSSSGVVSGVSAGTTTISYTVTGSCGVTRATTTFTVESTPVAGAISGATAFCVGTTATLSETVSSGIWSSGAPGVATINSSGIVTGISSGSATISYSVTNSCGTAFATYGVVVNTAPNAGAITGTTNFCAGAASTLTNTVGSGTWSSSNPSIATVATAGVVTGVSAGVAIISYTVTNSCGSSSATTILSVNPLPYISAITGASSLPVGSATTLVNAVSGGTWSSSNTSVATINTGGVVTGVAAGSATITYTLVSIFGCISDTTFAITVTPPSGLNELVNENGYRLFPNPASESVTISWNNNIGNAAEIALIDVSGKVAFKEKFLINATDGNVQINVHSLSTGMYVVRIVGEGGSYYSKLVLE